MKRTIHLSLFLFSFCISVAWGQESYDPFSEMEVLMVSSGQLYPSQKWKFSDFEFNVVIDEKQDTIYIQTMDPNFQTKEGYHVNSQFKDLPKELQKKVQNMPGWGYYIELESGWQLGFCEGRTCTDQAPSQNSTVKWVFKRPE